MSRTPVILTLVCALASATLAACGRGDENPITLSIVNAKVWTGDASTPWAEAVAIANDRIAAVGTDAEIRKLATSGQIIDAKGGMVSPGFIDTHVHFPTGGRALASVQLRDAVTKQEFVKRIAKYAGSAPKGAWIRNGDWDHQNWGGELPTREWIDSVTPDNPVWINRLDGHMALANSIALALAKVDATTPEVAGGTIVRDKGGNPTGVLKDNAMTLVESHVPPLTDAEWEQAIKAAMAYVASRGVTSVHDMDGWEAIAAYHRLQVTGRLHTRIMTAVPLSDWKRLADSIRVGGRGDAMLRLGRLKGFVDGSLGSHTAAMLAPFTDSPRDSGLFVTPPESLYRWTKSADSAGLQVAVHAIGDRAIRTQLDIFERVERENPSRDRRFRIEHAQHIAPTDIARFKSLNVIASMQPYHAVDDGRWADAAIGGKRALGAYAFRSLLDAGAVLAFGSDWFVAPPDPLSGIQAAVNSAYVGRKKPGGMGALSKDQC